MFVRINMQQMRGAFEIDIKTKDFQIPRNWFLSYSSKHTALRSLLTLEQKIMDRIRNADSYHQAPADQVLLPQWAATSSYSLLGDSVAGPCFFRMAENRPARSEQFLAPVADNSSYLILSLHRWWITWERSPWIPRLKIARVSPLVMRCIASLPSAPPS